MLPQLQAEKQLLAIEASSFGEMKPADRASTLRRLMARVDGRKRPKSAVEALMGAGIAVTHVPTTRKRRRKASGRAGTRRGGGS